MLSDHKHVMLKNTGTMFFRSNMKGCKKSPGELQHQHESTFNMIFFFHIFTVGPGKTKIEFEERVMLKYLKRKVSVREPNHKICEGSFENF